MKILFRAKLDDGNLYEKGVVSTASYGDKGDYGDRIGGKGMIKLRLVCRAKPSLPQNEEDLSLFETADLGQTYFPGRGLPFAIVYHIVVFFAVFYFQVTHFASENTRLLQDTVEKSRNEPRVVMFLPILGSDIPPESPPAAKPKEMVKAPPKAPPKESPKSPPESPPEELPVAAAAPKKGLVYPGPQPIISNPPNPTNSIQTVLQPAIEDPEILVPPLTLPNIVEFADASTTSNPGSIKDIGPIEPPPMEPAQEPVPEGPPLTDALEELSSLEPMQKRLVDIQPAKAQEVKLEMPPVEVAPPAANDAPKLVVPAMEVSDLEVPPLEPLPKDLLKADSSPKVAKKLDETPLPQSSPMTGYGADRKDLLAITPIPAPLKLPVQVPSGEARGSFAISPKPNLDTSETEPGTPAEMTSSESGSGNQSTASIGNPDSDSALRNITFGGSEGSTEGKNSATVDLASVGTGTAEGTGTGTGQIAGPGKKAFSGISIAGGTYDPGAASNPDPVIQVPKPVQHESYLYGLTVISTENSGGGLPFVGVFSNEQVYTVYLDMRKNQSDAMPSWTLEFALSPDASRTTSGSVNPDKSAEGLILPMPIKKMSPMFPDDLVRKHLNGLAIVYAVVNANGKMEQISVKASPDARLNAPILDALRQWIFRPAQFQGEPVAVKALLGIPIWWSR